MSSIVLRVRDNYGVEATLDILQEAELLIDISAIESGEIGELFGLSSQEFMLPGSDNNNKFFANMYDIGATPSIALNHTIYASVLLDGQEVFAGRMYVNDILTDNRGYTMYKAVVVNEFVDFKQRIEGLTLGDLDLSSLNHDFNYGNVTSSWDETLVGGNVVYPLVDYGSSLNTTIAVGNGKDFNTGTILSGSYNQYHTPLEIMDFKPGVKVKAIIDAIFDKVNYQYSSSFIEGDYFDKIFMLATNSDQRGVPGANLTDLSVRVNFSGSSEQTINDTDEDIVIYPNEVYDNGNAYDPVTGTYTAAADGDYYFGAQVNVGWTSAPSTGEFRQCILRLKKNGVEIKKTPVITNTANDSAFIFDLTNNVQDGDVFTITAENKTTIGPFGGAGTGATMKVLTNNSYFTAQKTGTLATGSVDMSTMFSPEIGVEDFLTAIFQRFNFVIEPKYDERNVLAIEPFNSWRGSGEVKDWSPLVDHSVRKSIKGTMVNEARFLSFKDSEDSDYLNAFTQDNYKKVFGEKLFEATSDLTQGTREISNQFFSPTPVINIDGDNGKFAIPALYEVDDNLNKKPIAFKPRLLHYIGKKSVRHMAWDQDGDGAGLGFWLIDPSDNSTNRITQVGLFHYLDLTESPGQLLPTDENPALVRDLNWNNSDQYHFIAPSLGPNAYFVQRDAIYEYWADYVNHLYDEETKTLTLNIKFEPTDLADIQLNDKIFIDGHYYRINNISSFNLTKPTSTQVELITAPIRFTKYPRRRIYDIEGPDPGTTGSNGNSTGGTFTDITLDPNSVDDSGTGTYVYWDDFTAVTGSGGQLFVSTAAGLDGFNYFSNNSGSVNVQTTTLQNYTGLRRNINLGNNDIDWSAQNNVLVGNNNTINSNVQHSTIVGSGNVIEGLVNSVQIYGVNNAISESVSDAFVVTSNKTLSGISQSVILQPSLDVENYESGRVVIGNLRRQGQQYENYKILEGGPGEVYNLTGSDGGYFHYHLSYTSSVNGTTIVYLPSASLDENKDVQYRFTTDDSLTASKLIAIVPVNGESIDGNPEETLSTPYDGMTAQNIEGEWIVIQRKK